LWLLEIIFPWRKEQAILQKILARFILSFFQFFLLNLILLIALSNVMEQFINDTLHIFGFELMSIHFFNIRITTSPRFIFILPHKRLYSMECTSLIAYDSFGKSIKHTTVLKMGFAAHFRYNWMEPLVYKSILYIPIILIEV
jgi:hypothetical protein